MAAVEDQGDARTSPRQQRDELAKLEIPHIPALRSRDIPRHQTLVDCACSFEAWERGRSSAAMSGIVHQHMISLRDPCRGFFEQGNDVLVGRPPFGRFEGLRPSAAARGEEQDIAFRYSDLLAQEGANTVNVANRTAQRPVVSLAGSSGALEVVIDSDQETQDVGRGRIGHRSSSSSVWVRTARLVCDVAGKDPIGRSLVRSRPIADNQIPA